MFLGYLLNFKMMGSKCWFLFGGRLKKEIAISCNSSIILFLGSGEHTYFFDWLQSRVIARSYKEPHSGEAGKLCTERVTIAALIGQIDGKQHY